MKQYKLEFYKSLTLKELVTLQTRLYEEYIKTRNELKFWQFVDIKSIIKPLRERLSIKQEMDYWNLTINEIELKSN